MAKLTLSLDDRSSSNSKAHVRIRISHRGTNCFIGTGVYVEPAYFQPGILYDPISRRAPMAVQLRERITEAVRRIEWYLEDVSTDELSGMTANDIRDRCGLGKAAATHRSRSASRTAVAMPSVSQARCPIRRRCDDKDDFLRWYYEYGEGRSSAKTRQSYAYGWNVLNQYCRSLGMYTLTFNDITYERLSDFARWLKTCKRGESTRHMLESYVRAAYKEAQRRRMVSREHDPYYDYSIKPVPLKEIETMTAKELHILATADIRLAGHRKARDMAMVSFYLCGANLLDIYEMDAPKRGEVRFVRHKVASRDQRPLHIRIEPELKTIIEQYSGCGALLNMKANYPNYESFRHKIAHRLQEVGGDLGIEVSMARIRRTWATIACSLGVSDWVIDKSMGHVDNTITRRHYAEYDWRLTAEANRKVIDYVLKLDADDCLANV